MKLSKKIAALAVASAVIVSGFAVAQSAQAAVIPSSTLTITPVSGTIGAANFLNSVATNQVCPTGFQDASITSVVQGALDVNISDLRSPAAANPGNPPAFGFWGLGGATPIQIDRVGGANNYLSNAPLVDAGLADGNFELRVYCFADRTVINSAKATSPWFSLTLNKTGTNWSVVVPATATSVSLTASAAATNVTLTATVTPAAAAGTVTFLEGANPVATGIAVVAGVASTVLAGVTDGPHTYTAQFVPTNPAAFTGSTSLGASVVVGAITAPGSSPSNITVIVPTGAGNLFLTSSSASVALGTASLGGGTFNASGTLNAVVTDQRQIGSGAWNLTGLVSNFARTVPASPAASIAGTYLGWTPAVVANTIGSTAGPQVLPSATALGGLMTSRTLASGTPDLGGGVTTASALLALAAPANTAAGTYSATLTLTLI